MGEPLTCPQPDCDANLHLIWTLSAAMRTWRRVDVARLAALLARAGGDGCE